MADEELNLATLLSSVCSTIAEKLPALKTVEEYGELPTSLATPAVAVEINSIEPSESDPGTGQIDCVLSFSAFCIVSYKREGGKKSKLRALTMAASLMAVVKDQQWGQPIGLPTKIAAYPDEFEPGNKSFETWRVDWEQSALLGVNALALETLDPPQEIYLGYAPKIGPGNEEHYHKVDELPTL